MITVPGESLEITPAVTAVGKTEGYQQAAKDFMVACGAKPVDISNYKGLVYCNVPHTRAEALLAKHDPHAFGKAYYFYRERNQFGSGGDPDILALMATSDMYTVVAAEQTQGNDFELANEDLIKWLKALEKDQPFIITEAGLDFLAGKFTTPVKDPKALAERMYKVCPDIVDQGTETVEALAQGFKDSPTFFMWWD